MKLLHRVALLIMKIVFFFHGHTTIPVTRQQFNIAEAFTDSIFPAQLLIICLKILI